MDLVLVGCIRIFSFLSGNEHRENLRKHSLVTLSGYLDGTLIYHVCRTDSMSRDCRKRR